jgi:cell division protein FtsZ
MLFTRTLRSHLCFRQQREFHWKLTGYPIQRLLAQRRPLTTTTTTSILETSCPQQPQNHTRTHIYVCGIGGAGCNTVNYMIQEKLQGVEFVACNTDYRALSRSLAPVKIQLGTKTTRGLGTGAKPEIGAKAAEEVLNTIVQSMSHSHMVFLTAGFGGGTGTGATPIIGRALRSQGILTVAVVTKPFDFEGGRRRKIAEEGLKELRAAVDTMLVIPNQNLFRVITERTPILDAFHMTDQILYCGVRTIINLLASPALISLDFGDIRSIMADMGTMILGTGEAEGEDKAKKAAELAIHNQLLDNFSLKEAKGVLINVTGGSDLTLHDVNEAAQIIKSETPPNCNIIFGSRIEENMATKIRVSVVATGLESVPY